MRVAKLLLHADHDDVFLYWPITFIMQWLQFCHRKILIDVFSAWHHANLLTFKEQRCKSVVFSRKGSSNLLFQLLYILNYQHIENVNNRKFYIPVMSHEAYILKASCSVVSAVLSVCLCQHFETSLYQLFSCLHLEYAHTVWDPFFQKCIHLLENWKNLLPKSALSNGAGAMRSCNITNTWIANKA